MKNKINYLNRIIRAGLMPIFLTWTFLGCVLYGCNGYTTDWTPSAQSGSMADVVSKYEAGFYLSTYLKSGSFQLLGGASSGKFGQLMVTFDSDTVCYRYEIQGKSMIFYNAENGEIELEFVGDDQETVRGFWLQENRDGENPGQLLYWHFEGGKVEVRAKAQGGSGSL